MCPDDSGVQMRDLVLKLYFNEEHFHDLGHGVMKLTSTLIGYAVIHVPARVLSYSELSQI
jgi:hypothetical protein